jgi:type VI secretion system protein
MPSERGLFDRLRQPDPEGGRSAQQRTERVADSVLAHLVRLLNTRHGESPAAPRYGIPAFEAEHITTHESMQREIERSIQRYEPRLEGTRVRALPRDPDDPLRVRFEITARLLTAHEKVRVRFTSQIEARGEWKVTP